MLTSKYRRLSSWGTALMPGTLFDCQKRFRHLASCTHGSAINLSVSLMILLGSAMTAAVVVCGRCVQVEDWRAPRVRGTRTGCDVESAGSDDH